MQSRTSWKASMILAAALLTLPGCATGKIDRLQTDLRKSQEQLAALRAQLRERDERIAALMAAGPASDPSQLAEIERLKAERDQMQAALDAAEGRIRSLGNVSPVVAMLPAEIDTALAELAAANPEIMTYDSKTGMIKFRSDFTFALGSTSVRPEAARTLGKLASIVNLPAAGRYEVVIVGHTDNVPIKRVKAEHPTNWHLSVHRAIAVKDVLRTSGVNDGRMAVKGYGENRPVVANGANGSEANRRVELYLMPATGSHVAPPAPAVETPRVSAPAGKPDDLASFK